MNFSFWAWFTRAVIKDRVRRICVPRDNCGDLLITPPSERPRCLSRCRLRNTPMFVDLTPTAAPSTKRSKTTKPYDEETRQPEHPRRRRSRGKASISSSQRASSQCASSSRSQWASNNSGRRTPRFHPPHRRPGMLCRPHQPGKLQGPSMVPCGRHTGRRPRATSLALPHCRNARMLAAAAITINIRPARSTPMGRKECTTPRRPRTSTPPGGFPRAVAMATAVPGVRVLPA